MLVIACCGNRFVSVFTICQLDCFDSEVLFFILLNNKDMVYCILVNIIHSLTGMRAIVSLLFPENQLFPKGKARAIVDVKGNNKLAITRISSL